MIRSSRTKFVIYKTTNEVREATMIRRGCWKIQYPDSGYSTELSLRSDSLVRKKFQTREQAERYAAHRRMTAFTAEVTVFDRSYSAIGRTSFSINSPALVNAVRAALMKEMEKALANVKISKVFNQNPNRGLHGWAKNLPVKLEDL